MFEHLFTDQDAALVDNMSRADRRLTIATDKRLIGNPRIGSDVARVQSSLSALAARIAEVAPDRSEEGLNKEAKAAAGPVASSFKLLAEAQRKAVAEVDRRLDALHTPKFPTDSRPEVRAEQRSWGRSRPLAKRLDAMKADPALAKALVEGGPSLSELPQDIFQRARREMAIHQLAETIQVDHQYRTEPTPEHPIGGQPDMEAARTAATATVDALEAERELLASVPTWMSNVVLAVSLMTEETLAEALARLYAA